MVELLFVLALSVILVAAAIPGIHRIGQEWALWGAARILETSLQWARMHAVATNSSLMLVIDSDRTGFVWVDPVTLQRFESTARRWPPTVALTSSPSANLRFFPRGNAAPAGTFVVGGKAGSYRVVVNPAGRIRFQRN